MKVVEAFSGIGSQSKALTNIEVDYDVVATIEWEMGAIYAYDIIHNGPQDLSKLEGFSREKMVSILRKYSLSSNGKEPIKTSTLSRYPLEALKRIYAAILRTNNLVSIMDVTNESFNERIDLFTYSFPCQDLSLSGSWHGHILGINRDANNRSSMLWQVERILIEMIESGDELPHYLMMENVTNILSERHLDNFNEWRGFLTKSGYYNHVYKLNAEKFGIPQRRKRAFMISVYVGDTPDNTNSDLRQKLKLYFEENDLEKFQVEEENNLDDFLRMNYDDPIIRNEVIGVIPNNTVSRKKIRQENDLLYNGQKQQNFVRTITTKQDRHPNSGVIDLEHKLDLVGENKAAFRYLTPRECFLLMGFEDKDFNLLLSNNFQYNIGRKFYTIEKLNKLAGNSIVVNILEQIFKQIISIDHDLFDNRMNVDKPK